MRGSRRLQARRVVQLSSAFLLLLERLRHFDGEAFVAHRDGEAHRARSPLRHDRRLYEHEHGQYDKDRGDHSPHERFGLWSALHS
jgi:hypothetical protein